MRLNVNALNVTFALFWALAFLTVNITNLLVAEYGSTFPGHHSEAGFRDILAWTLYALADACLFRCSA